MVKVTITVSNRSQGRVFIIIFPIPFMQIHRWLPFKRSLAVSRMLCVCVCMWGLVLLLSGSVCWNDSYWQESHSGKKRVIILGSQQQATVNVVGSIESLSIIMHLMNVQTTTDICLCIKRLKIQHFELLINLKDMFIYYLYSKLLKYLLTFCIVLYFQLSF